MSIAVKPILKRELLAYRADVKGSIFRQIREMYARLKAGGFTQKAYAAKINMDEGQLSRRLRGDYDLKLETLSDLARGLDCRIAVTLIPLAQATAEQRADEQSELIKAAANRPTRDQDETGRIDYREPAGPPPISGLDDYDRQIRRDPFASRPR
jgi:transcriptional regulator with XRE-family HTH domain